MILGTIPASWGSGVHTPTAGSLDLRLHNNDLSGAIPATFSPGERLRNCSYACKASLLEEAVYHMVMCTACDVASRCRHTVVMSDDCCGLPAASRTASCAIFIAPGNSFCGEAPPRTQLKRYDALAYDSPLGQPNATLAACTANA